MLYVERSAAKSASSMPVDYLIFRARIGMFGALKCLYSNPCIAQSFHFDLLLIFRAMASSCLNSPIVMFIGMTALLFCFTFLMFFVCYGALSAVVFICKPTIGHPCNTKMIHFFIFKFLLWYRFITCNCYLSVDMKYLCFALATLSLMLLLLCGDISQNPGPNRGPSRITFGFWNVNSILAREGSKIPFIESYQSDIKFDIFGVCESALNDKNLMGDISIQGFSEPFRSDAIRSNNHAQGGVLLYFRENLPIIERKDLNSPQLEECIISEIRCKNEKIFLVLTYRTPSQRLKSEIEKYSNDLQTIIDNVNNEKPSCIVIMGDMNARSPMIWSGESKEELAGKMVSNLMNLNNFQQQIDEPTHLPSGDIATCIDVIYTNQPYLLTDCGVLPSPDPKCKHQLIYGKVNFHIPCPPKYKRKVYDYHLADTESIKNYLREFKWEELLEDKSTDNMVSSFNKTFLGIIDYYIPSKIITVDDRDAPWITPLVKRSINKNKRVYKRWIKNGKDPSQYQQVQDVKKETEVTIRTAKRKHIDRLGAKLCDPTTGQK